MLLTTSLSDLHEKLTNDPTVTTTIVTVNQRLTGYLRQQYDVFQQSLGKKVWPSADILPFSTWIKRCWNDIVDSRIILSDFQEQLLRQKIISQSAVSHTLLRIDATATLAKQAWRLLQQWNINLEDIVQ